MARFSGMLTEVLEDPEGSAVVGDLAAGVSVVPVAETSDFGDEGTCRIGEVDYTYTVDHDASELTITPVLASPVDDGDPVAEVGATGEVESTWKAVVLLDLDDEGEPIQATIWDRERYRLGVYDPPEPIEVDSVADGYEVAGQSTQSPTIDSSAVQTPVLSARRTADGNVADATDVTLTSWTVESSTSEVIAAPVAGEFVFAEPGHYMVLMTARWANNSTGRREAWPVWHHASGDVPGPADSRPAEAITGLSTHITDVRYCEAGEAVSMLVKQTSGANLTLRGGSSQPTTTIRIIRVGP